LALAKAAAGAKANFIFYSFKLPGMLDYILSTSIPANCSHLLSTPAMGIYLYKDKQLGQ